MTDAKIIEAACNAAGCLYEDYIGGRKHKEIALARHFYRWYQKRYLKRTYETIWPKSHATALHSVRVVDGIFSMIHDDRRPAALRFIAMMKIGKSPEYVARARGKVLLISNCSKMAIYDENVLTIMDIYGNVRFKESLPKLTIEDLVNILNIK